MGELPRPRRSSPPKSVQQPAAILQDMQDNARIARARRCGRGQEDPRTSRACRKATRLPRVRLRHSGSPEQKLLPPGRTRRLLTSGPLHPSQPSSWLRLALKLRLTATRCQAPPAGRQLYSSQGSRYALGTEWPYRPMTQAKQAKVLDAGSATHSASRKGAVHCIVAASHHAGLTALTVCLLWRSAQAQAFGHSVPCHVRDTLNSPPYPRAVAARKPSPVARCRRAAAARLLFWFLISDFWISGASRLCVRLPRAGPGLPSSPA